MQQLNNFEENSAAGDKIKERRGTWIFY